MLLFATEGHSICMLLTYELVTVTVVVKIVVKVVSQYQ